MPPPEVIQSRWVGGPTALFACSLTEQPALNILSKLRAERKRRSKEEGRKRALSGHAVPKVLP